MADYRLYLLDDRDRIQHNEQFHADDDAAAIAIVRSRAHPEAAELWCMDRWVLDFPRPAPKDSDARSDKQLSKPT